MENKRVVKLPDAKAWIKRIIEILELFQKYDPEKYGELNTDLTKSYVSKTTITVTMQDDSFDNPYCEFPNSWLMEDDTYIKHKIICHKLDRKEREN